MNHPWMPKEPADATGVTFDASTLRRWFHHARPGALARKRLSPQQILEQQRDRRHLGLDGGGVDKVFARRVKAFLEENRGEVYIARNVTHVESSGGHGAPLKIGMTRRGVTHRAQTLVTSGVVGHFEILWSIATPAPFLLESWVFLELAAWRIDPRGEHVQCGLHMAAEVIGRRAKAIDVIHAEWGFDRL